MSAPRRARDAGDDPSAGPDVIRAYLNRIGRITLLTAQDEVTLAKRIETGLYARHRLERGTGVGRQLRLDLARIDREGRRAKAELLEANLRLVVSIAKRYAGRGLPLADLIQEGNLGLMRAVEKFDYAKGYKFSTYATWWIRQAISRGLSDQARTIRLPTHTTDLVNALYRARRTLGVALGRDPTAEELAAELQTTPEAVLALQRHARDPVSLDQTFGDDGDARIGDLIEDTEALPAADVVTFRLMQDQLASVLDTLTEREAGIIRLRFGLGDGRARTLDEIGAAYGVTRERIRQLEAKTMAKLRHPARSEALRDYLA
jgi:RNA polymerase primary sigma factor